MIWYNLLFLIDVIFVLVLSGLLSLGSTGLRGRGNLCPLRRVIGLFYAKLHSFVYNIMLPRFVMMTFLLFVFGFLVEKRLVEEVRKNDTLIIVGETGSGKTTRESRSISMCFFPCC